MTVTTQRVMRVRPHTAEPCKSVVYIDARVLPVYFDADSQVVGILHSELAIGTLAFHENAEPTFVPDEHQPYVPDSTHADTSRKEG